MDIFVELIIGFAKTFRFNLACIGQLLPFVMVYLKAKHTGIDVRKMGIFVTEHNIRKYRVLIYKVGDELDTHLCYGLDSANHQFVLVGQIKCDFGGNYRIAYSEDSVSQPQILSMSQTDCCHPKSSMLYTGYQDFFLGTSVQQPMATDGSADGGDGFIDLISLISESDIDSVLGLGFDDQDDKSVVPSDDVIDTAIISVFTTVIVQDEFVEHVLKLTESYNGEACVHDGDNLHRFLHGSVLVDELAEWRGIFRAYGDGLVSKDKLLFLEADFLHLLLLYAFNANALNPKDHVGAQSGQYAELMAIATAKHDEMVNQTHLEACRLVANATTMSSRFIQACREAVLSCTAKASYNKAGIERIQTTLDDIISRRQALFGNMQGFYDEQISAVRHMRHILRLSPCQSHQSHQMDTGATDA